jgi:hypothetical protein
MHPLGSKSGLLLTAGQMNLFKDERPTTVSRGRSQSQKQRNWATDTQALLERHFRFGESIDAICSAITIDPLAAEARIAEMRKIKLGLSSLKDFGRGYRPEDRFPHLRQQNAAKSLAAKISSALETLAPRDPVFYEGTIRFLVHELLDDQRIVLGVRNWKEYASGETSYKVVGVCNVIRFVEMLDIKGLEVRYSGCLKDGAEPDLSLKLRAIGARKGAKVEFMPSPNSYSRNHHEQLGISVVNRVKWSGKFKFIASDAFRHVIILALVRRIWRTPEQEIQDYCASSGGSSAESVGS